MNTLNPTRTEQNQKDMTTDQAQSRISIGSFEQPSVAPSSNDAKRKSNCVQKMYTYIMAKVKQLKE